MFAPKVASSLPADFSFQVSGAGLQTGGTTSEFIKLYHPGDKTWCGIVHPKESGTTAITITLTYNGVNYSSTINCALAAKTHYQYTLSLRDDILVPEANGILGWTDDFNYTGPID